MPDLTLEEARERLSGMAGLTFMGERARYNEQLDALIAAVRRDYAAKVREAIGGLEGAAPTGLHGYLIATQDGPWIQRRAALAALEGA
jgi:hypothetical protein